MQTYSALKYKGPVFRANSPILRATKVLCDDIALCGMMVCTIFGTKVIVLLIMQICSTEVSVKYNHLLPLLLYFRIVWQNEKAKECIHIECAGVRALKVASHFFPSSIGSLGKITRIYWFGLIFASFPKSLANFCSAIVTMSDLFVKR